MATIVYMLCAIASLGCAVLLLKSYAQRRARLLYWSGLCFLCLGLSNTLLFLDLAVFPQVDLFPYRSAFTLGGLAMLLYGLIWETT